MASVPGRLQLFGFCAVFLAMSFAIAAQGETASVVVGLAECSDCTRKNMNSEAAFKGLHVAIKCKNSRGEYESKAVGQLDKSGTFSIPLAADLLREDGELKQDCLAQLHSKASGPCPGQEPSKIIPQSKQEGKNTFVAVAGEVHYSSPACASAFLCDRFHKKHFFHKPEPEHKPPKPDDKPPVPKPDDKPPVPKPDDKPPTAGCTPPKPTPIYHPPVQHN